MIGRPARCVGDDMRHVRNVSLAGTGALFIAVSLILAIGAAQPSGDGVAGRRPSARQGLVQNLKEVNYYPAAGAWTYMWSHFDPAAIDRDFARIRALDANTVRIVIQPSVFGFPVVHPVMANRLSEVIGLAAKHSLRVQLTLFDWWSRFSDVGGSKYWVSSLLSRYRDDPHIAVVELQNEFNPQNRDAVAWVNTMLPYLSTVMPGTLRTVSTGSVPPEDFALLTHELKSSPPDFWDYHYYGPAGNAYSVLSRVRALASPRPLFVGETGYSTTGNPGDQAARNNAQRTFYRAVFSAAAALRLPAPAPWTLNDFSPRAIPPGQTADSRAQYGYGLFQLNGTPKPAAAVVRRAFSRSHCRTSRISSKNIHHACG
jgi:hypothetical protein